jgi:hypothetical protein
MASMARRNHRRSLLPADFGLGLVVVGSLLCVLGILLFVVLGLEGSGPGSEGARVPDNAYRETPAAAPTGIAAQ